MSTTLGSTRTVRIALDVTPELAAILAALGHSANVRIEPEQTPKAPEQSPKPEQTAKRKLSAAEVKAYLATPRAVKSYYTVQQIEKQQQTVGLGLNRLGYSVRRTPFRTLAAIARNCGWTYDQRRDQDLWDKARTALVLANSKLDLQVRLTKLAMGK
jgi:hypothetical protein